MGSINSTLNLLFNNYDSIRDAFIANLENPDYTTSGISNVLGSVGSE